MITSNQRYSQIDYNRLEIYNEMGIVLGMVGDTRGQF